MKIYQLSKKQVIEKLKTNIDFGLSEKEVKSRLKTYGLNKLPDEKKDTYFTIFIRQFKDPLIYALIAAATILAIIDQWTDVVLVSIILVVNAIIGAIQEGRAAALLESLKKLLKTEIIVIREGKQEIVQQEYLVPGDIIIIKEGDKIPADCRLLKSRNLKVDEAALTGESEPILKSDETIEKEVKIYDQTNMVFQGTYVLSGNAIAVVTSTGIETEIGKITKYFEKVEPKLPIREEIKKLAKIIINSVLIICAALFIYSIFLGNEIQELLITLSALFISVVPEGLPLILMLTLAFGAHRMGRHRALIKQLRAVETLGRINILMIDKTGTITRNELMVSQVYVKDKIYTVAGQGYFDEGEVFHNDKKINDVESDQMLYLLGICSALMGRAKIEFDKNLNLFKVKGEPIEAAMQVFAKKLNIFDQSKQYELIYEIPFKTEARFQAAFYKIDSGYIAFVVGSKEVILKNIVDNDSKIEERFNDFLDKGYRVIGISYKEFNNLPENESFEFYESLLKDTKFLAILGLEDSIRTGAKQKVQELQRAGIRIILVTGDHKKTAQYVAEKVGIIQKGQEVIEGHEFEKMSEQEKIKTLNTHSVYARVIPQNKLEIAQLLQKQNFIVGMTGDGVNDAPALAAAQVGIAMGNIGTEVAKEAADIILLDDSIMSIAYAVKEGRHTFYTLKRIITYYFSTNLTEFLLIISSVIMQLPLPLLAGQILWVNLVTDGFLDSGLVFEPFEDVMLFQKWDYLKGKIIDKTLLIIIILMVIPQFVGVGIIFLSYYSQNLAKARTLTFLTLVMFQWFNAWNCKSLYKSLLEQNLFANKWLIGATFLVISLQIGAFYIPFLSSLLRMEPITTYELFIIVTISSVIIITEEIRKFIVRKYMMK